MSNLLSKIQKLVHEGKYIVEVEVELLDAEKSWGPYLTVSDAERLDGARKALREGDLKTASTFGKVYRLVPVSAA